MKICPRCGSHDIIVNRDCTMTYKTIDYLRTRALVTWHYVYSCRDCGHYAESAPTKEAALENWENTVVRPWEGYRVIRR